MQRRLVQCLLNEFPSRTNSSDDVETVESELPKKRKKSEGRQTSNVWPHFDKAEDGKTCKCKYCGKQYRCETVRHGTSSMRTHLTTQCFRYWATLNDDQQMRFGRDYENKSTANGPDSSSGSFSLLSGFDKEACRLMTTKYFILSEKPFREIEAPEFRLWLSTLCPKFEPSSRRTLVRDIFQLYLDEKKELKRYFTANQQRISITTDTWTSANNMGYMVVTSHWVDVNWALQKRILGFFQIANHKGDAIGKLIETCLLDWGIERLMTITVDNASANDVAVSYVKRKLKNWDKGGLILEGEYLHLRCCAHIVNLIVNEGLKEIQKSISGIRNAVKYVRSSPSRLAKFKSCVELEKIEDKGMLVLDVPTRWNSTYMMLSAALKFRKAFDRLGEEENEGSFANFFSESENGNKREGPPTDVDWKNAEVFTCYLKTFNDVTVQFSASLTVTSNLYFHHLTTILSQIVLFTQNDDIVLRSMACKMRTKFDKYWGTIESINQLLIIAVILDPRYKLVYVSFCLEKLCHAEVGEKVIANIKESFIKLYEYYCTLDSIYNGTTSATLNDILLSSEVVVEKEAESGFINMMKTQFKKSRGKSDVDDVKNEIDRYLLDLTCDGDETFSVLHWWKSNCSKYRILSTIAKDVFAIPVSTVASESAFSTGGRILDPFRSSLTPKMVEALVCTQNWLRCKLNSVEIKKKEEESLVESFKNMTICEAVEKEMETP